MKKTVLLLAVVCILAGIVFILPSASKKKAEDDKKTILFNYDFENQLTELSFEQEKPFKIEKKGDSFQISLVQKKVGTNEFDEFLKRLKSFKGSSVNIQEKEDSKYKTFLRFKLNSGQEDFLKIGEETSFGKPLVYVQTAKGNFVVDKILISYLKNLNRGSFRDHQLTDYDSSLLKGFILDDKEFFYDKKWYIKGLSKEKTDTKKTFYLFATITAMQIKSFTQSEDLKQYNLHKPRHKVTLLFKDGKKLKLLFSEKDDKCYALKEGFGEIVEIFDRDFSNLGKTVKDFEKSLKKVNLKEKTKAGKK